MNKDVDIKKVIESNQLDSIKTRLSDGDYLASKSNDKSRLLVKQSGADKYSVVSDLTTIKKAGRALIFADVTLPKEKNRKVEISVPVVYLDWSKGTHFRFNVTNGWANFNDKPLTKEQTKALLSEEVPA